MRVGADALLRNYRRIVEAVGPETGVLPMVKADAYGLGMEEVVARLEPEDPWGFGVATVSEGMRLREAGVTRPVVVCSPVPPGEAEAALEADLQLSISSLAALERVVAAARRTGRVAELHLDVDTGMGRSGFDWRSADAWLPGVEDRSDRVRWVGSYTHLHSADEDGASVATQWDRFSRVLSHMDGALRSARRSGWLGKAVVRPGIFLRGRG